MTWGDTWPDWQDAGKRVELTMEDGSTVVGVLTYDDFSTDGADEFPIWKVRRDDGSSVDFVDHEGWRFVTTDQPSVCNWRADDEGVWESDCGQQFCLEDDPLPSVHGMKFCHGCGKPLAEHPYVEPPVCGECGEELEDGKCPEGCVTPSPTPAPQPSASLRCQSEASVILRSIRGDIEAAYNGLDYLTSIHVATAADPNGGRQLAIDAAEIKGRLLQHMKRIDAVVTTVTVPVVDK